MSILKCYIKFATRTSKQKRRIHFCAKISTGLEVKFFGLKVVQMTLSVL